ncbi:hypothetical protein PQB34_gp45 [Ochrobactrum phage POI1126]|uniref:Uncharacterized protein n=1 Tax=Ochrobactrum phage POI1126 TaxID=1932118 RepID=A0A240F4U6_9CAUD|nr:hypothetical protein [Brucella intermedia]YP_010665186.1 hypothetical protein PQB34_gp45 [Ochrobactrum phage POI1126]APU92973.1 hypothetical protein POI1126_46 [Ochrobactrum phage POI1126]NKB96830.1 hypothetical protein [Brucella intermedia]SUA82057.1 Uncharacterised protein [Brucella intermedia]
MKLEELAKKLLQGEFSSLRITCNDHKSNYQTAQEAIEDGRWYAADEFVSPEELQKAIGTNTIWSLQWYPQTPAGFQVLHASSFQAILDYVSDPKDGTE